MDSPNTNASSHLSDRFKGSDRNVAIEQNELPRWEDEGGQIAPGGKENGGRVEGFPGKPPGPTDGPKVALHQVGDTVIHWAYGRGKIVAIEDKGLPGEPCSYYVIEGSEQTVWVPVEEFGNSSLQVPVSRKDFSLLIQTLRSKGEKMSKNPYERRSLLFKRMHKASSQELCLVIRDLNQHARRQKLNSSDIQILKRAQSVLLNEWERSFCISRDAARLEMASILKAPPTK